MLKFPLRARASLVLGQGLAPSQLDLQLEGELGLCPGELGALGCGVSSSPQKKTYTTGW